MSDRPHKQASTKVDPGSGILVISLLMELWMGDGNCSLPLCVYLVALGKFGHTYIAGL